MHKEAESNVLRIASQQLPEEKQHFEELTYRVSLVKMMRAGQYTCEKCNGRDLLKVLGCPDYFK